MREENNNYFKEALSDFAYDMACGTQIRHLADLGYTISQILEELDISVPFERVRKTVNEHLLKTGVLLAGTPDHITPAKKTFVREYDSFGSPSFRQIVVCARILYGRGVFSDNRRAYSILKFPGKEAD